MAEKKKLPEIRFKGFSDEWENRKFSETFSNIANNTLSRAELNYNFGQGKNVHYGDVLVKFGELLDIEKDEIPFITNDVLVNKFKTSKLQDGDIIIADAAEDELVGKCTELINVGDSFVFSGLHTIPARPTLFFASKYLGYFMNSLAYHNQLLRLLQGTKVLSISKSAIKDTSILFPNDTEEQSQIGKYFQNLDKLITLHQQKYDKLVILKRAMLEKMFPKNGADVPEIRFKGFEGKWEERKLGDFAKFRRGSFPQPYGNKEWYDGDGAMPFVQVVDVAHNLSLVDNTKQKISLLAQPKSVFVKKGTVVVTLQGSIGRVAILQYDAYVDRTLLIFEDYESRTDIQFWAYLIQQKFEIEEKIAPGGTIKTITKEALSGFQIIMPEYEEQKKIGHYLENLDKFITLHQKELEKLKNIKKACLEKMFV